MTDHSLRTSRRATVLRDFGAGPTAAEELLRYNDCAFVAPPGGLPKSFPIADEPQIEAWRDYLEDATSVGAFESLRRRLVQLCFPIREGVSQESTYLDATRRGEWPALESKGLRLERPEALNLDLHLTAGGRVPVLIAGSRADFVALLRALAHRNEPIPISDAVGASMVSGLNNWDRVERYREQWGQRIASPLASAEWPAEMQRMAERKELYQDRIVLLSRGPYSDVPAAKVGMTDEEWLKASLTIRREHECVHAFTKRIFQSARNNLMDELLSDYAGIVAAAGHYRADWFLLFLGIESGRYNGRGRLSSYRGEPPLSSDAMAVLCRIVERAAANLERFDRKRRQSDRDLEHRDLEGTARMIVALTTLTLEELASDQAESLLRRPLDSTNLRHRDD